MTISTKDWLNYIQKMRKLSDAAADAMQKYVQTHGFGNTDELIDYAYALVTKYGEGAAALACQMYDETAALSGKIVDAAVPAETATYEKTAQAIEGSLIQSPTGQKLTQVASRLVKQAASDTTLQNAVRDGAWFAWVPSGDSCPYCLMLGAIGWQRAGDTTLNGRHAKHIHANCDCQYVVDLKGNLEIKGYDPDKIRKQMLEAYGDYEFEEFDHFDDILREDEKGLLNASRRLFYQDNKDKILMQKKIAYAKRTGKVHNEQGLQEDAKRLLMLNYDEHRRLNNLRSTPAKDIQQMFDVNYGNIDKDLAYALNRQIEKLTREYDSPLNKIRLMDKQEYTLRHNTFAFVSHSYETDTAELVLNPAKFGDRTKLVERMQELKKKGYSTQFLDKYADKYVATHEFAHTLINMQMPLSEKRNWVNADYKKIKQARKEIENVYNEYKNDVELKIKNKKAIEFEALTSSDEKIWESARKATKDLESVKISDYSLESSDEFLAESFAAVKLGSSENPYAVKCTDIINKYFKKG